MTRRYLPTSAVVGMWLAVALATADQLLPSLETSHVHLTRLTPPSGSLRVAVRGEPACGCVDERDTTPGSSTLVTVTVTARLMVWLSSRACTVRV